MKKPLAVIIPALALTLAALGSVSARAAGSAMTAEGVPAVTMQEIGAAAPGAPAALDISAQPASFPAEIETMALDAAGPAAALTPQAAAEKAPAGAARAAALGKKVGAQRSGIAAAMKSGGAERQISAMYNENFAGSSDDASIAAGAPGAQRASGLQKAPAAAQNIWKAFSKAYGDKKTGFDLPGKSESFTHSFPQNTSISRISKIAQSAAAGSDFGGASLHRLTVDGKSVYAVRWSADVDWGPDAAYYLALFDQNGSFIAGYYNNTTDKSDRGVVYDVNRFVNAIGGEKNVATSTGKLIRNPSAMKPGAALLTKSGPKAAQSVWNAFSKEFGAGFNLPKKTETFAYAFPRNTSLSRINKIAQRAAANAQFASASVHKLTVEGRTVYAVRLAASLNWTPADGYFIALFDKNGAFIAGRYDGLSGIASGVSYDVNRFVKKIN